MNGYTPSGSIEFRDYNKGFLFIRGKFDTYGFALNDQGKNIEKDEPTTIQFGSKKNKNY